MSISETTASARPRVEREIALLAVAGSAAAYIASPADPALTPWSVHPVWALALLVAARYGARGLWIIPALALGLAGADLLAGDNDVAAFARLSRGGDLAALSAVVLCAAIGTAHERRKLLLEQRLAEVEARAGAAEAAVGSLVKTAIALHDHRDRSDTSLAFLADVSARMTGKHPSEAAGATLDLALARTGARAGLVQIVEQDGSVRTLLSHGSTRADDRTAAEAKKRRAVVFADEVADVSPADSDVAVAMVDDGGKVVGVLALRGLPYARLDTTLAAELACIARWAAPALARALRLDTTLAAELACIARWAAPALARARRRVMRKLPARRPGVRVALEREDLSLEDQLQLWERRRGA